MEARCFEDFNENDTFETLKRTLTETDLVMYLGLARINTPIFADDEFARKTRFGARIIPGPLVVGVALGLVDNLGLMGENLIALVDLFVEFAGPAKIGDTISVRTVISAKEERSARTGAITLSDSVVNQTGEEIIKIRRRVLISRRKPTPIA